MAPPSRLEPCYDRLIRAQAASREVCGVEPRRLTGVEREEAAVERRVRNKILAFSIELSVFLKVSEFI